MEMLWRDSRRPRRLLLSQFVQVLNRLRKLNRLAAGWIVHRDDTVRRQRVEKVSARVRYHRDNSILGRGAFSVLWLNNAIIKHTFSSSRSEAGEKALNATHRMIDQLNAPTKPTLFFLVM